MTERVMTTGPRASLVSSAPWRQPVPKCWGSYDHRRAALQEVRVVVEEATQQRRFEHRLMDFNNLPETRFDDVKQVLRTSAQRVAARLKQPQP